MSLGVGGFGFRPPDGAVGSSVWGMVSILLVVSRENGIIFYRGYIGITFPYSRLGTRKQLTGRREFTLG